MNWLSRKIFFEEEKSSSEDDGDLWTRKEVLTRQGQQGVSAHSTDHSAKVLYSCLEHSFLDAAGDAPAKKTGVRT